MLLESTRLSPEHVGQPSAKTLLIDEHAAIEEKQRARTLCGGDQVKCVASRSMRMRLTG